MYSVPVAWVVIQATTLLLQDRLSDRVRYRIMTPRGAGEDPPPTCSRALRGLLPSPAMRRIAKTCGALVAACALATGCGKVEGAADAPMTSDDGAGPDAARSWSAFAQVAVSYTDQVRVPVPSGDGLTLYFLAQLSGTDLFDVYSASRASTGDGFGV